MLTLPHSNPVIVPLPNDPIGILLLLCMALLWESFLILRRFWRKHSMRRVFVASV